MSETTSYTFHDLKKMKVKELREVAKGIEHEAVQGYTQLNKEHLLEAVCKALSIDMFEHHHAEVMNKAAIKAQIKKLKKKRDEAAVAHDQVQLKFALRTIHRLKRKLHKAVV
ncbi:MAG: hypothetical protein GY940_36225 [bacterium]|nr:hypothetical protein [bacterium]